MGTLHTRTTVTAIALVAALTTGVAVAGPAAASAQITSVAFTGNASSPTITITGTGFGVKPPNGYNDHVTSCGVYARNGHLYGHNGLWFLDDTNLWRAGQGNTKNGGNCIGIIVKSWSTDQVVIKFGSAYGSYDHWTVDEGDNYVLNLKGYYWGGVASYS